MKERTVKKILTMLKMPEAGTGSAETGLKTAFPKMNLSCGSKAECRIMT